MISNSLKLTGTGLTFFKAPGVRLAGVACNFLGFSSKQIHDYLVNSTARGKMNTQQENLDDLIRSKNLVGFFNTPIPKDWLDNFGLKVDWKVVTSTLFNTGLQLTSLGLACWNIGATWHDNKSELEDPVPNWVILTTILLSHGLDLAEQHLKKDNLSRRNEQLTNNIHNLSNYPTPR